MRASPTNAPMASVRRRISRNRGSIPLLVRNIFQCSSGPVARCRPPAASRRAAPVAPARRAVAGPPGRRYSEVCLPRRRCGTSSFFASSRRLVTRFAIGDDLTRSREGAKRDADGRNVGGRIPHAVDATSPSGPARRRGLRHSGVCLLRRCYRTAECAYDGAVAAHRSMSTVADSPPASDPFRVLTRWHERREPLCF